MKKQLIALFLVLTLAMFMIGCKQAAKPETKTAEAEAAEEVEQVSSEVDQMKEDLSDSDLETQLKDLDLSDW